MRGRAFHPLRRNDEAPHAVAPPPCQLRLWRPCALRLASACTIYSGLPIRGGRANSPPALGVARCFPSGAQAQPPAIMRAMFVLCLAFCALGHCVGSSLRVERRGSSREGRVGAEAFMLINGKSGPQEMCLTIIDGNSVDACGRGQRSVARAFSAGISQGAGNDDDLVLESCVDSVAAGDGRELWVMQPGGRIAAVRGGKCISVHDGLVSLSDCEASDSWELQANNQLKSASGGGGCLSGSGASSGSNVALRAAVHASSAIDVAHGARPRSWTPLSFWMLGDGHARLSLQVPLWPLTGPMPLIVPACYPHAAAKRRCNLAAAAPVAGRPFHRGIWRFGVPRASCNDIGLW